MRKTKTYNLEYFEPGSFYSSASDYRRFSTLDYNLKTFIGIAGNGVIRGWDIKVLGGRVVKVNPGCGFISGLFTESPWIINPETHLPKRKSEAIADGDDIFEEIPGWSNSVANEWSGTFYNFGGDSTYNGLVFDKLGPDGEDANHDGIIDGVLQPHYKDPPDNYFSNPYVKAVSVQSSSLLLPDNDECFIYATRVSNDPKETYASFSFSSAALSSDSQVLLAKVLVKNNVVVKIEYSDVFKLKSLESSVSDLTNRILKNHKHGGNAKYDPPKVKLETDFRTSVFFGLLSPDFVLNVVSEKGFEDFYNCPLFAIIGNLETKTNLSHSHKYHVDSSGNGFTHQITEDGYEFHYHQIAAWVITNTITQYGSTLSSHSHDVLADKYSEILPDASVCVRINNKIINSINYALFTKDGMSFLVIKKEFVKCKSNRYKSEFNPSPGNPYEIFSYEATNSNSYNFIVGLMQSFYGKYSNQTSYINNVTGKQQKISVRSPFGFYTTSDTTNNIEQGEESYVTSSITPVNIWPTGTSLGTESPTNTISYTQFLWQESFIIAEVLREQNKTFQLLPYLARYIPIELIDVGKNDDVSVEILGEVEVTGKINLDNIAYIESEKFAQGIFNISYIPFINHSGDLISQFRLKTYSSITNDGFSFLISPSTTTEDYQHYHKVFLDKYSNGTTMGTYYEDKISVFKYDENGKILYTDHSHVIKNLKIQNSNEVSGVSHYHYINPVVKNRAALVFSTLDDNDGNVFLGTSMGLLTKNKDKTYKINIEGCVFYDRVSNLFVSLLEASSVYNAETGNQMIFDPTLVADIENSLKTNSSTQTLQCIIIPIIKFDSDTTIDANGNAKATEITNGYGENKYSNYESFIEIGVTDDYAPIKNFQKISVKIPGEMDWDNEDFLYTLLPEDESSSSVVEPTAKVQESEQLIEGKSAFFITKKDFHKQTICGGIVKHDKSKTLISPNKIYKSININGSDVWQEIYIEENYHVLNGIARDGFDNIWISSDCGALVSSDGVVFKLWGSNLNCYDVIEAKQNQIIALFSDGIYKTDGLTPSWTKITDISNPRKLSRNFNLDKTSVEDDHFHYIISDINGNGYLSSPYKQNFDPYPYDHTHSIVSWNISKTNDHIHAILSTIFCKTSDGIIYQSSDSGNTWIEKTTTPLEYGTSNLFLSAFSKIFVSTEQGLFNFDLETSEWSQSIEMETISSLSWAYDLDKFYVGCLNKIYLSKDGISFEKTPLPFSGVSPITYMDGREISIVNVLNNKRGSIFLKENSTLSRGLSIANNYDQWLTKKWGSNIKYDILQNGKVIYTSEDGGSSVSVNNNLGLVDFSISSILTSNISYGERTLTVENSANFFPGDEIEIIVFDEIAKIAKTYENKILSTNETSNFIELENAVFGEVPIGSKIIKSFMQNVVSNIEIKKKEQGIKNSGIKTHEQIEDAFSQPSIGMPFQLSNSYLNNLSQLTLFLKYGFQNVDENYKNWLNYMMRYERSPDNANYIGNFIDIDQSRYQTGVGISVDGDIIPAAPINVVYFGSQDFKEMVFIGTNVGLFVGIPTTNFNNNWFLVPTNIFGSVYDVISLKDNKMLVCGFTGAYVNDNSQLSSWSPLLSMLANATAYFSKYRWKNSASDAKGWWDQWQGDENLKDKDLTNDIIVGGRNFVLTSNDRGASWIFAKVSDIYQASKEIINYVAKCFCPLSNGGAFLGVNNAKFNGNEYLYKTKNEKSVLALQKNLSGSVIYETQGVGELWNKGAFYFKEYAVLVAGIDITANNNTKIFIDSQNGNYLPHNGLIGSVILINGKQWKIIANASQMVVVYGNEASQSIRKNDVGIIQPIQINGIVESINKLIITATSSGVFYDKNSYYRSIGKDSDGVIAGLNKKAIVLSVDTDGFVVSLIDRSLSNTSQTEIVCTLNHNVDTNGLVGYSLVFTSETNPSLYIISPLPNTTINSTNVTVTLMVQNFGMGFSGQVAILIDDRDIEYVNGTTFTIANLEYGTHKLNAFLVDASKNKIQYSGSNKTIYFETEPTTNTPYINIQYPNNGENIKSTSFYCLVDVVNFSTIIDGSLAYLIDSQTIPTQLPYQGSNSYKILINGLSSGSHTLKFLLLDTNGKEKGVSSTVQFNLSSEYPSLFLTYPYINGVVATSNFTVSYTVGNFYVPENGKVKIVLDNNSPIYSEDSFSYPLTNIADGTHTLKITLVDTSLQEILGTYTSDSIEFSVNSQLSSTPTLAILSPKNGDLIPKGSNISVYFSVSGFLVPEQGSIQLYVNGSQVAIINSLTPYILNLPNNAQYLIEAYLIDLNGNKLSNSQSASSISVLSSDQATAQVVTPVDQGSLTEVEAATGTVVVQSVASATTSTTTLTTETKDIQQYFEIVSNSSSSAAGTLIIKVNGIIDQKQQATSFKVIGKNSILYVSYTHPVQDNEFDGGKAYVIYNENETKIYDIKEQTKEKIELSSIINPQETIADTQVQEVSPGQFISLVPKNGIVRLGVNFSEKWNENDLSLKSISLIDYPGIEIKAISNTTKTIDVAIDVDPSLIKMGDNFKITTPIFTPLSSFNNKKSSIDLDHYHDINLLQSILGGDINSIAYDNTSYITIYTKNAINCTLPQIQRDPLLLNDATILFYKGNNASITYTEAVYAVYEDKIIIKAKNVHSDWNINGSNPLGIDVSFSWEINARFYGETNNTYYVNFSKYISKITKDVNLGDDIISVDKTSSFKEGDNVNILDNQQHIFSTNIKEIIDDERLLITESSIYSFLVKNDSQIEIKVNDDINDERYHFSSSSSSEEMRAFDHYHVIKDGEIEAARVENLFKNSYPEYHAHYMSNLIESTNCILKQDDTGQIIVGGNNAKTYGTDDGGLNWKILLNTNEINENIHAITSINVDGDLDLIMGTDIGLVIKEGLINTNIAPPKLSLNRRVLAQ